MPKTKPGYYAVRKDRKPGIYLTWEECESQVKGFSDANYQRDKDLRNLSERLPGEQQTNNRAEIYAVIKAIESCENKKKSLEIFID
ncbi:15147_t:CDS:2, partial [Racocetra persica]